MATIAPAAHRAHHTASYRYRKVGKEVGFWALLSVFIVFAGFPVYWMFITAFKQVNDLYNLQNNPFIFNLAPTFDQVTYLFQHTPYATWLANTLEVGVLVVLITLVLCVPAAYVLARTKFPGSDALGIGIFLTYLVPPTLLFLPLAFVVAQLHLFNNYLSLILTYPTFLIPFCTWLLMGYFKGIPRELEEAALVDGASRLQAMTKIVLPLALPGILSAGMFAFTLSWNEFLYSLIFMSDQAMKTIPVGVTSELIRGDEFFWGQLMAAALLGSIPVALLYSFFVDYFVAGMTAGAVKG